MSTNTGSVVILPHVSPKNNQHMESPEQTKQVSSNVPTSLKTFLQGEPEVLGIIQLFIGINHILLGIFLTITFDQEQFSSMRILVKTHVVYWSGILFIISGSLSVAASSKASIVKVYATLTLNIISCIAAVISIIIVALFLLNISIHYYYHHEEDYCSYSMQSDTCEGEFSPATVFEGIGSILLLFTALEFCIVVSTSIFGCKIVCRTSYNEVAVVIYHNTPVNESEPALSSDGEVKTC